MFAKATKRYIKGNLIAVPSLEIEPTILVSTIPPKADFTYKAADAKRDFGTNGKILQNISSVFACAPLMCDIANTIDFRKFAQVKKSKIISDIKTEINLQGGTSDNIRTWIDTNKKGELFSIPEFNDLSQTLRQFDAIHSDIDSILAAFQIIDVALLMGADFKKAVNYLCFLDDKAYYEHTISTFNTTRHQIRPKVDKKHNRLIVEWPKAHEISNGQRDVLSFITLLMRAKRNFRKQNCILVIDEIFDYLDDANLISFQYFITDMIEEMKRDNKNFFPILMTHLDPLYFT